MIDGTGLAGIGLGVGVLYGAFGAGGSAFATPLLALAGVPAVAAVASPLAGTIPAALAGAWSYRRDGDVDAGLARRSVLVGAPAAVVGAAASGVVPGEALLVLSAVLLLWLGIRMAGHTSAEAVVAASPAVTTAAVAATGLASGLLANSGGFLLVPVFVLLAGRQMRQAAATSLLVAAALSIPTLATHWALGHVDWTVAAAFTAGLLPGTVAGTGLGKRVAGDRMVRVFGAVLVAFAAWFLWRLR